MFPVKQFPLQQGDVDSLCAIYSVLNCLFMLGELDDVEEAENIFKGIALWLGEPAAALAEGFDPANPDMTSDITKIGRKAAGRKMLDGPHVVNGSLELGALVTMSEAGGLIYFRDKSNEGSTHYSVVRKARADGMFLLCDSYGMQLLACTSDGVFVDGHGVEVTHFWAAIPKEPRNPAPARS